MLPCPRAVVAAARAHHEDAAARSVRLPLQHGGRLARPPAARLQPNIAAAASTIPDGCQAEQGRSPPRHATQWMPVPLYSYEYQKYRQSHFPCLVTSLVVFHSRAPPQQFQPGKVIPLPPWPACRNAAELQLSGVIVDRGEGSPPPAQLQKLSCCRHLCLQRCPVPGSDRASPKSDFAQRASCLRSRLARHCSKA